MNPNYAGFPGLGISMNINPVAFSLWGKDVYWYGILIAVGILAGLLVSTRLSKKEGLPDDTVIDVAIWSTPIAIICARLYYCIFSWDQYADNPWKIFYIWEGGIAIYGAVIGAVITAYLYCRVKKLSWRKVFDVCIVGVLTGQAIGRWGNFVNKEAYGTATNLPWRMEIYSGSQLISVHPTFLYESLWNFIGIFVLLYINKRKKQDGETFFSYLIWYGIGRAFIEGLRTDSLYWGALRISQVVAVVTAIFGMCAIVYFRQKAKNDL